MTEDTDFSVKSGTNPAEPSLTGSNKYYQQCKPSILQSWESYKGHPLRLWLHNEQSKFMWPKCWINSILFRLTLFDCINLCKFIFSGANLLEAVSGNFISCNDLFRPLECHLFPSRKVVQNISLFNDFPLKSIKFKLKKKSPMGLQTSLMVWATAL